jgi:hypothetical protein
MGIPNLIGKVMADHEIPEIQNQFRSGSELLFEARGLLGSARLE